MNKLLLEGHMSFKRLFLKMSKLSALRIFGSNLFHSNTAERKKQFRKKVMFYFELGNIRISCVICTHGNRNNVK